MAGSLKNLSVMRGETFSLSRPFYVDSRVLSTTAQAHSVPNGAGHVLFSCSNNFCAAYGSSVGAVTAVMPSTTPSTAGDAAELNPLVRQIFGVAELSLIAQSSCYLTMAFFKP